MKLLKSIAISVFFIAVVLLPALEIAAKDDWVRVRSKNFNLIGNASESDIRRVGTRLEQFREAFRLLFSNTNLTASVPTNVIVFKSDAAYRPFKPRRADGTTDVDIAGYFQSGDSVNYITLSIEGRDQDVFGTIFHEYVHFIIQTNFAGTQIPQWFNEGLAEYYQTFEIVGDIKVRLGLPQPANVALLQQSPLMPLEKLLNFTNYQLHQSSGTDRDLFYAQSWALVHYLTHGGRSDELDKYLRALPNGAEPRIAFQEAFQTSFEKMGAELRAYVTRSSYNTREITLKLKLTFDSDMQSSKLDEASANAHLGELLYYLQRPEEAELYLNAALKANPDSSLANATLGVLRLAQRKFNEARTYLERAIASDPKDHLVFYRYANLLSQENRDEFGYVRRIEPSTASKIRGALRKAIDIEPTFAASYELLAFVSFVNNEQLDEAVDNLKIALKYQPANQLYSFRIAEILTRQGKFDEATKTAEQIARTSQNADLKSRASSLLSQIVEQKQFAERRAADQKLHDEQIARSGGTPMTSQTIKSPRPPTEEETTKQNEHLRMRALNEVLRKPLAGEQRVLGKIQRVDCKRNPLSFVVKTAAETFSVTTKDFTNLFLRAHDPRAMQVQVGCNENLSAFTAFVTFRGVAGSKATVRGELVALEFVPTDFRFMSEEEMRVATLIIYDQEVSPKTNVSPEVISIGTISEDLEANRRLNALREINSALKKPQAGERRAMGFLEKIECTEKSTLYYLKTTTEVLRLESFTPQSLSIYVYAPDLGNTPLICGMMPVEFPAVFVYTVKPDTKNKTAGEILSIEFVPKSFVLDQ